MPLQDSKYFKASELACHDGTPYPDELAQRGEVLLGMLDKIREALGSPILVVSGYRTPAYNAKLAQDSAAHQVASSSQHVEGRAADLRPAIADLDQLHRVIEKLLVDGKLPELGGIGIYPHSNWVHVDTFKAPGGHIRRWLGT